MKPWKFGLAAHFVIQQRKILILFLILDYFFPVCIIKLVSKKSTIVCQEQNVLQKAVVKFTENPRKISMTKYFCSKVAGCNLTKNFFFRNFLERLFIRVCTNS